MRRNSGLTTPSPAMGMSPIMNSFTNPGLQSPMSGGMGLPVSPGPVPNPMGTPPSMRTTPTMIDAMGTKKGKRRKKGAQMPTGMLGRRGLY